MALAEHTTRVTSQFEFSDAEINRNVQEFLKQMSKSKYPQALEPVVLQELNSLQATDWKMMVPASAKSLPTSLPCPMVQRR